VGVYLIVLLAPLLSAERLSFACSCYLVTLSEPANHPVAGNGWWGAFFTNNGQKKNTQTLAIATGCFAGATESVVVTPFELVKIKLQDKKTTFKGPLDVIKHTVKTSGPLG